MGWEQGKDDEQAGTDFGKTRCQKRRFFLTQVSLGCCRQMMGAQRWHGRGTGPGALWRGLDVSEAGGQHGLGNKKPRRLWAREEGCILTGAPSSTRPRLQHPQDSSCQLQGAALMHAFLQPGEGLPGIPSA